MKVLISGADTVGLTLAFRLQRGGHDLTAVEKSPSLRDEGYMIDFFGSGYDRERQDGPFAGSRKDSLLHPQSSVRRCEGRREALCRLHRRL
jgi:hypothetical protein